ncbi:MAG: hypothetical protein R6V52_07855, partial [Bacteroidales bacterium]
FSLPQVKNPYLAEMSIVLIMGMVPMKWYGFRFRVELYMHNMSQKKRLRPEALFISFIARA